MALYDRLQRTAERLLIRFGGGGTLVRETAAGGPAYDPGEPTEASHPVTAVVVPTEIRDRSGTLIEDAASTAYIAAKGLAIVPQTQDRLLWSGRDYRVVRVMPIDPSGGKPVLYELRVEE